MQGEWTDGWITRRNHQQPSKPAYPTLMLAFPDATTVPIHAVPCRSASTEHPSCLPQPATSLYLLALLSSMFTKGNFIWLIFEDICGIVDVAVRFISVVVLLVGIKNSGCRTTEMWLSVGNTWKRYLFDPLLPAVLYLNSNQKVRSISWRRTHAISGNVSWTVFWDHTCRRARVSKLQSLTVPACPHCYKAGFFSCYCG